MALSILEVSGLTFDEVVIAMEKALGQIITCIEEVKDQHHTLANSGIHMQGYLLTSARLIGLNEVQRDVAKARETLRRV